MLLTAADVEVEHKAALVSMTPTQWRAVRRLDEARRLTAFKGCWPAKHLPGIFAREAEVRNAAAQADAQQAT